MHNSVACMSRIVLGCSGMSVKQRSKKVIRLDKYRHKDTRGERSPAIPDVNISVLAAAWGVDRSHLSRLLNGRFKPGRMTIEKISRASGVSWEVVSAWFDEIRAIQAGKEQKAG